MKKMLLYVALLFVVVGGVTSGFGQSVVLEPVSTAVDDTTLPKGFRHDFAFRYQNPGTTNYNVSNGWRIFSPDGAEWSYPARDTYIDETFPGGPATTTIDSILVVGAFFRNFFDVAYFVNYFSPDGMDSDTLAFSGAAGGGILGLQPDFDDSAVVIPILTRAEDGGKHICIDSSWFPPGGTWKWAAIEGGGQVEPSWTGQKCFRIGIIEDVRAVEGDGLPEDFSLSQNYPNPFNPTTKMPLSVPYRSHVTLTVYNILGQEIITLVDEQMAPNSYEVDWDGRSSSGNQVASGIYFYKMEADNFVETKKMMLLK
jgi:hypothetical protein